MRTSALTVAIVLGLVPAAAQAAPQGSTLLVSRSSGFGPPQADGVARSQVAPGGRAVSRDGRYVVFVSQSDALDPDPADDALSHCYLRDTVSGTTTLVDRADGAAGAVGTGACATPSISPDGSVVAFASTAANLVPGDTNDAADVFIRSGTATTRVSVADNGGQLAEASGEPDVTVAGTGLNTSTRVVFTTGAAIDPQDADGAPDVYMRRLRQIGSPATFLISRPTGGAAAAAGGFGASISADGLRVAFLSDASIDAGDSPGDRDAYMRNMADNSTTFISRPDGAGGEQNAVVFAAQIARDGNSVGFLSTATNLGGSGAAVTTPNLYLRRLPATTIPVSVADGSATTLSGGWVFGFSLSDDASRLAFMARSSNLGDGLSTLRNAVHMREIAGNHTVLISRGDGATGPVAIRVEQNVGIAGDGSSVVFESEGHGMAPGGDADANQVFVRTPAASTTRRISRPTGPATDPFPQLVANSTLSFAFSELGARPRGTAGRTVSRGGRYAVFSSHGDGLLPGAGSIWGQVFIRDMLTGETRLISATADGTPGDGDSGDPVVSADGAVVAFTSSAPNLGSGPDPQVLAWRRDTAALTMVSATGTTPADGVSVEPAISADGNLIAFSSSADNLGVTPPPGVEQVWVRNLASGALELVSLLPGAAGAPVTEPAGQPAISADGNRVAFVTRAVVPGSGDTGPLPDVYVRDRAAGQTLWASRPDGAAATGDGDAQSPSLNRDGTVVAFASRAPGLTADDADAVYDVFTRNLVTGRTVLQSRSGAGTKGDGNSLLPAVSDDGTRVAFTSQAANLTGDDADGTDDVFVRDGAAGTTTGVSRADGLTGALLGSMTAGTIGGSPDMDCIAFESRRPALGLGGYTSQDLSQVYLRAALGTCGQLPMSPGPATVARMALSRVSLRPARFRTGTTRGRGTTLRFTLSRAGRVTIRVQRPRAGRVLGARCVAGRTAGKRCTVWTTVATRVVQGSRGANTVRMTGRFGRRTLAAGCYRLRLTPGSGATAGAVRTVPFRVLRAR